MLALPVLMVVCMGLELPKDGPVPAAKPVAETTEPALHNDTPEKQALETEEPAASHPEMKTADKPASLPGITAPKPDEIALAHCEAELRKLGAIFERGDPVRGENGCGIEAPYKIDQIIRGVALSPASQLRCDAALALARWADAVVVPATASLSDGTTLTRINHGSTYVCRRRNNNATGKMSEHAIGDAIDVVSFEFKGRDPIPVSPRAGDGTMEEAFQRAIRGGACLHFTTVLGPGTNASHADHLHLDIIERKGGYRLCE